MSGWVEYIWLIWIMVWDNLMKVILAQQTTRWINIRLLRISYQVTPLWEAFCNFYYRFPKKIIRISTVIPDKHIYLHLKLKMAKLTWRNANEILPVWHCSPEKPVGHWHMKLDGSLKHKPPFMHGVLLQWFPG